MNHTNHNMMKQGLSGLENVSSHILSAPHNQMSPNPSRAMSHIEPQGVTHSYEDDPYESYITNHK